MATNAKRGSAKVKKIIIDKDTEDFLAQLQLRPFIYDKSADLHSDRDMLNMAWHDIGKACNLLGKFSYVLNVNLIV